MALKFVDEERPTEGTFFKVKSVTNFVSYVGIEEFNMFRVIKFTKDSRISHKLHSYSLKYPEGSNKENVKSEKGVKQFLSKIANKSEAATAKVEAPNDGKKTDIKNPTNPLPAIVSFLEKLTYSYNDGKIVVNLLPDKNKRKLQFLLLNPSAAFQDIVKEARSVIGGNLR